MPEPDWEIIADDERYIVKDAALDDHLTASLTHLKADRSTRGHRHPHAEVLFCMYGRGVLRLGVDHYVSLYPGAHFFIEPGVHHRVTSAGIDLGFVCAFAGDRENAEYDEA